MVMTERPVVRRVNIELTDQEFTKLLGNARTEDVHRRGVYDLRGAIITIWERPWADPDAWKYLSRVGEIHYQHPSANVPPTVRRLATYGAHTVDDLLGHLAHLIGRERKSMTGLVPE